MIYPEKIVAVVIWYNPTTTHAQNIETYIKHVHKVIIIDNSESNNAGLLTRFNREKIIYEADLNNKGIAKALNIGCKLASANGAEWALTLDQDSSFFGDEAARYIQLANEYPQIHDVAIFSATHYDSRNNNPKPVFSDTYSVKKYAMTSGNLLSLNHLSQIGFFLEDLFIDWVDEELCLRISKHNLLIVQINPILLEHFVGNGTYYTKFFGKRKSFDDYAPIRYYYIARNLFILNKLYPADCARIKKRWMKQTKRTILYDTHNKWTKLKFIVKGIIDYQLGVTGKYPKELK